MFTEESSRGRKNSTQNKNKKIYNSLILLDKYHMLKLKTVNIVYVHLRRSLWLKPPLYSDTLFVNKHFGDVFPNFFIYQKLNIIKGLIYLNIINSKFYLLFRSASLFCSMLKILKLIPAI